MPEQQHNIIRTVKNRANPYTMISREVINNAALSWEARGVLAYLLDKPDNWEVRFQDLVSKGPGGRDHMRRILRELEAAGHIERSKANDTRGRIQWETIVFEVPRTPALGPDWRVSPPGRRSPSTPFQGMVNGAPSTPLPSVVKPSVVKPSTANPSIYRDGRLPSTGSNDTEGERDAPPLPTVENFTVTLVLHDWVFAALDKASLPRTAVDVPGETEAWRDQIRSAARPVPADVEADWRMWIRRAIHWAKTHPQTQGATNGANGIDRGSDSPAQPAHDAEAERRAADKLRDFFGSLPAPGLPAG